VSKRSNAFGPFPSPRAASFELEMLRHDRERLLAGRSPASLHGSTALLLQAIDCRIARLAPEASS